MSDDKSESKAEPLRNSVVQEGLKFDLFRESARVVGLAEDIGEVNVPEQIEGRPVTVVAKGAFRNAATVRKVTLPRTVTLLGANAFENCSSLTNVELPSDLETINASVFLNCARLETVRLPAALERIASQAFSGCTSLRDLSHFVATGPKSERRVQRNLVEHSLPVTLSYIGEAAFSGCEALRKIVIPYQVTSIPARAFENCGRLGTVWLHSGIAAVGERAFSGCTELKELRLPRALTSLGEGAFDLAIRLITEPGSPARSEVERQGFSTDICEVPAQRITSSLGDEEGITVSDLLTRPELLRDIQERYEIRPPVDEVERDVRRADNVRASSSRFTRVGNVYRSEATSDEDADVVIAMVGDIMCGFRQQRSAVDDLSYDFEASFEYVHELLSQSDLAVGNLESMVSEVYPFMHERLYVDDRPNLNSPHEFLSAVRNGGFDAVMSAQNHMYDTGAKGILQTLDALNHANLIHGGLYADRRESRHTMFEIKGMKIAIVAFLDPARQRMKQANFTEEGLDAMASLLDDASIRDSITEARNAGAEFVLAYCHWGSEYTETITTRQAGFAQMVADAGADYIFGSHSHCPQHFSLMRSRDGATVPVVFSGGNFLSDIQRQKPITQDTFISSLKLTRNTSGRVVVAGDGYVPCRIIDAPDSRGWAVVVPCETLREGVLDYDALSVDNDVRRISNVMGNQFHTLEMSEFRSPPSRHPSEDESLSADELVRRYSVRDPRFVMQRTEDAPRPSENLFEFNDSDGVWRKKVATSQGEAVLICAGSIFYDRAIERYAEVGDTYQFRPFFKHLRNCVESADLSVGSMGAVVADMYPPMGRVTPKIAGGHYSNARSEYLDGIRFAGFDCLALANPYNLDAGVRGLVATEESVREHGMVPSGLGRCKAPIFDVNGVQIAVLSYTLDSYRVRTSVTQEGARVLLNTFDDGQTRADIADARSRGAQFVLAYLDCRSRDGKYRLAERREHAQRLAESGADYVVCNLPTVLSGVYRFKSSDGRDVSIASSLGTTISGSVSERNSVAALLRIVVTARPEGGVEVSDSFIPVKRFAAEHGIFAAPIPAHPRFTSYLTPEEIDESREVTKAKLGRAIPADETRRVSVHSHYAPQLTPKEIARVLGIDLSSDLRTALGAEADSPVSSISVRIEDLRADGVAVITKRTRVHHFADKVKPADALSIGARMAISSVPVEGLPTLVVKDPWEAYVELMRAVRAKFDSLNTIAVTGTAGKTTTKDLLGEILQRHFRTLHVVGNGNTVTRVGNALQKLTDEDEVYLQEVHEGTSGSASMISKLIQPNIALITSIADGHLDQMGSIDEVVQGNMQITDGLREGGALIVNNDSEHLQSQMPQVRTIRYSQTDSSCDYYARDVRETGNVIEFEIVGPEGTFGTVLNFPGLHNVSNALGAFAVAREVGVPAHKIIAGLSRYTPDSRRQNLKTVGGVQLLIDAYNSNLLALTSAVDTLCKLPLSPGGRRIVVMGDMGEQGTKVQENHETIGRTIAASSVDLVLAMGDGASHTVRQIRELNGRAELFSDEFFLARAVRDEIRPGDAVLFKGAGSVNLTEKVIYPLFGRIV